MKNKELKINIPEGYVIDKDNSTFECIKFKPANLTYEEVAEELFANGCYYSNSWGGVEHCSTADNEDIDNPNNCVTAKQVDKLLAINKLMNVVKYLNGDWKPNWKTTEDKFCIILKDDRIGVVCVNICCGIEVHFKSEELAMQAVDILGEDTIRLALSTDW